MMTNKYVTAQRELEEAKKLIAARIMHEVSVTPWAVAAP